VVIDGNVKKYFIIYYIMECLVEYIYFIYQSISEIIEELNNESSNMLNQYGGFDDL
jgi:hypothetical protein